MELIIETPRMGRTKTMVNQTAAIELIMYALKNVSEYAQVTVIVRTPSECRERRGCPVGDPGSLGPVGLTEALDHGRDKKADYLESIHYLAMAWARELMAMDDEDPDLIVDLLHVAHRAKAMANLQRYKNVGTTNPSTQYPGSASSAP